MVLTALSWEQEVIVTNIPYSIVLEKLIVPQLVRKFLSSYGTQRFTTVFTR
jgi:hypothetical protein